MINSESTDLSLSKIENVKVSHFKLLSKHKEPTLAFALCLNELKLNPNNSQWLVNALEILPKISHEENSPAKLAILLELARVRKDFQSFSQLGHFHYQTGNYNEAFDWYEKAIAELVYDQSLLFEIYKNMGNICVQDRDFDAAEDFYHKAWTLKSDSDLLQVNLGTLAIQKNNLNEALERFRNAVELNGSNDKAWVGLALAHSEMGDFQLAVANIENALDINPRNRTAALLAAKWCQRDFRISWGIQVLEEYLAAVDCDSELSLVLVHLFCLQGERELALLELERLLLWEPKHTDGLRIEKELINQKKMGELG